MTNWGPSLAKIRKSSGLSRVDFGLRIGEPHYLLQRWEIEGREPLVHTALHVARRLDLRVDDLTGVRPAPWGETFTSSVRVGKSDTMWRTNIMAIAEVAGDRAAAGREILVDKCMVQSWVHRRSIPVLRTAVHVSRMTGFCIHDLLATRINAKEAVEYARVMRRSLATRARATLRAHA